MNQSITPDIALAITHYPIYVCNVVCRYICLQVHNNFTAQFKICALKNSNPFKNWLTQFKMGLWSNLLEETAIKLSGMSNSICVPHS